ncbi:tail length tape-measure protein [Streptococcus phage Javan268]|nr:tape measure domain protein [Streptococcus infantis SK970]QBX25683.1 tail length tape-measure protein [Streptococcus phage Javan268]
MADGSVTIKVDMDGSNAQSGISKLKSLFGGLESAGQKVGSVFKSVLGANLIGSALTAGIGTITSGIREMASELNSSQKAWKTFEGNLQAFGRSAEEIKAAKTEMQDFATKTIYSASDMASTYSQLDAVGTKNVGSLVKAFGGLAASAENPAQAMKSLSTQATQMASKPKIAWMDFKIMMEQAPAGMAAVAKEMGMSTADLVKAVQDGKVKTEDFFDALNRAGNSDAFQKMATEFKTVDQAIDGAKESLSNKLMPAFEKLNKFGIKAVNAISDALDKINFDSVADKLGAFLESIDIDGFISTITGAFAKAGETVSEFFAVFNKIGVFEYISDTLRDIGVTAMSVFKELTSHINRFDSLTEGFGNIIIFVNKVIQDLAAGIQFALEAFSNTGAIKNAYQAFKELSEAALDLYDKLSDLIPWETIGESAGKIVNFISQMASSFAKFIKGLDANTIRNVATALVTMAVAFKGIQAGVAIAKGLKSAFDFGKTIIGLIGNILGLTTAQFANAGASAAMSAGNTAVGTTASASAGSVLRLGAAVLMIGAGVLMAAAGVYVLVQAAIQLASAGTGAQVTMLAIVAGIALLAVGAAALGPALTAGAVGILAFGAAVLMIGAGVAVAALAVAVLVDAIANGFALIINTISSNAPQIISIIQAIAEGIRTAMDGIANIIISVGIAINIALQGIADIFKSVGESISTAAQGIGKGIESVFNGISTVISSVGGAVRTVLDGIANVFTSIGTAARNAGLGVKAMAEGIQLLVGLNLADLAGTLTVVSAGLAAIANSGIATAGPGLQQAGTGLMLIATSAQLASVAMQSLPTVLTSLSNSLSTLPETLTMAGTAMSTFATSVMSSFASLGGSVASVMMLQTGLMSLSNAMMMAQSGAAMMASTLSMINSSAMSASSAMSQLATAISSAMTQALSSVQASMMMMVTVVLQSSIQMTQAGQRAGQGVSNGVTNGIRSGIASATSAMSSMVSSIQATGMRGVSTMRYVGSMIGQGLASGMYSALGAVTAAANALVAQAERAAQAKAKIHSPSRLFRDNVGRYIAQGIAVGIEQNSSDVVDSLAYVQKEMSAFKFGAEDLLGLGKHSVSSQFRLKSLTERAETSQIEVIRDQADKVLTRALEMAEEAVKRPVNMVLDDGTLVAKIGDPMTNYQNDKLMIDNMMRGII